MPFPLNVNTLEDPRGPTQAFFKYQGQCCRCVVCRVVESGAILCIPRLGLDQSLFTEAESMGYAGTLGPFMEAAVEVQANQAVRRRVDVMFFDIEAAAFDCITADRPADVVVDHVTAFGMYRSKMDWPSVDSLREHVTQFISAGEQESRLAFYSAAEAPMDGIADAETPVGADTPAEQESDPTRYCKALLEDGCDLLWVLSKVIQKHLAS